MVRWRGGGHRTDEPILHEMLLCVLQWFPLASLPTSPLPAGGVRGTPRVAGPAGHRPVRLQSAQRRGILLVARIGFSAGISFRCMGATDAPTLEGRPRRRQIEELKRGSRIRERPTHRSTDGPPGGGWAHTSSAPLPAALASRAASSVSRKARGATARYAATHRYPDPGARGPPRGRRAEKKQGAD